MLLPLIKNEILSLHLRFQTASDHTDIEKALIIVDSTNDIGLTEAIFMA
jgi:hypothetical protein